MTFAMDEQDGSPLVLVPCTSEVAKEGRFRLQVYGEFELELVPQGA